MIYADWTGETTTSTGTGNLTLAGAITRHQTFNTAFGTNVRFPYAISNASDRENGIGYLSAATTLVRETILSSTNSNNAVNWGAGEKTVLCSVPAASLKSLLRTFVLQADVAKTNNTLATIADLTWRVEAGRWYQIEAELIVIPGAGADFKISFGGGTATTTGFQGWIYGEDAGVGGGLTTHLPSLGFVLGLNGTDGEAFRLSVVLKAQINAAGTIVVQFAQGTTNASAATLQKYSSVKVIDITP